MCRRLEVSQNEHVGVLVTGGGGHRQVQAAGEARQRWVQTAEGGLGPLHQRSRQENTRTTEAAATRPWA